MGSYLEEVDGKDFMELKDNPEFQKDLVLFFRSSRYGLSGDEMKELGADGLADKFVEHMRWQDTNEITALKDYNFVKQENLPQEELKSFGNLMMAYDRAEGGGTGALDGAVDYLSAFATSPSTLATVGTAGWGVGSKLAAKAAGKAAQLAMRQTISELVRKGVATGAVKDQVAGTIGKQALMGGVSSAVVEGSLGAGQSFLQGKTREKAAGEEYTTGNLLRDGLIAATIGGALGSATRALDTRTQRGIVDNLIARDAANLATKTAGTTAAKTTIASVKPAKVSAAADRAVSAALALDARFRGVKLDPLDPKLVEKGNLLKKEVLNGKVDRFITSNLSIDTLRSITAATIDIIDRFKVEPNERISSAVARGLRDSEIDSSYLDDLRTKYGLSKEQASYILLADFSQAGKTLAEASYIKQAQTRSTAKATAKAEVEATIRDLDFLAASGLETLADSELRTVAASVYKDKGNPLYNALKEADSIRIALMTSQLGTTAANTITSTANVLIDMSDQLWKNIANVTVGKKVGDKVQRKWVGGTLSTIKGLSWNKGDAKLFKEIFLEELPEQYSELFYEASRAETASGSTSRLAKVGRGVNVLNSTVDSVFKQGVLYSSVDRQLRDIADPAIGKNLGEFLSKNIPLDNLPEGVMTKAIDDARRFTFQRSYRGDKSAFGKVAQGVIDAHHKLPFVVSAGAGIPFPRYIANHLEHVNDYTLIGLMTGGLNKYDSVVFGDVNKTGQDRFARQMTGASIFMLGAYTAASTEGTVDYDKLKTDTGLVDLSRTAGPWLMNMYLGDLYYRWKNDLPTKNIISTMMDISIGQTDLGIDAPLFTEIAKSYDEGVLTVGLARSLGDIAATFTYPLTPTRDFYGQLNPELGTTPYTREVLGGDLDNVETYGEGNFVDEMIRRATRFLPEVDFVQYAQSYNGKSAIPYYGDFSGNPLGTFDPLSKQLGMQTSTKPNELQKEMSRMQLKTYELYGSKKIANPAVDVFVGELISKNLPRKFFAWRDQVKHGGRFGDRTYSELTNTEDQRFLLNQFIQDEIAKATNQAEQSFIELLDKKPRLAAGYVRNLYVIEERKAIKNSGDKGIYDTAVRAFTNGEFADAASFIGSSEIVEEEVRKRQAIMAWSARMVEDFEGFPDQRRDQPQ
jgi:hypothetical protein